MQHSARTALFYISAALLLGLTTLVAAHGDDDGSNDGSSHQAMQGMDMSSSMSMEAAVANSMAKAAASAPGYFHNSEHQGWLYAHIVTMMVAWVIILPIGISSPSSFPSPPSPKQKKKLRGCLICRSPVLGAPP